MIVMKAGSIPIQLMNSFFLASGLVNDLLIIRICLTLAYSCLLISGLLGLPSWGEPLFATGRIAPDTIVWAVVNIVVIHGSGVIRMYYDERSIEFEREEHEMLWRFYYRHSGLSKAQFLDLIVPHLELRTYQEGDPIACTTDFSIILDGSVRCDIVHVDDSHAQEIVLVSGDMFPLIHIYKNFMPHKSFFHRSAIQNPVVESPTARIFSIPIQKIEEMAFLPSAKVAWSAMLTASLAEIVEREFRALQGHPIRHTLSKQTSPLFGPLLPHEEPDPLEAGSGRGLSYPIQHALRYVRSSVYLPWPYGQWPVGLRHCLPAPLGDDAYERMDAAETGNMKNIEEISIEDFKDNNSQYPAGQRKRSSFWKDRKRSSFWKNTRDASHNA